MKQFLLEWKWNLEIKNASVFSMVLSLLKFTSTKSAKKNTLKMPSSTIIDSELGNVIDWKTKMTK